MQTVTITLGGNSFTVPAFTIGQIEQIAEATTTQPGHKVGFSILKIALARSTPPLNSADVDNLVATFPEISAAVAAIMAASGLDLQSPNGAAPAGA